MQDRPEDFSIQTVDAIDLVERGRNVRSGAAGFRQRQIYELAAFALHPNLVTFEPVLRSVVDHRTDVGREIERIADELTRRLSGIGRVWVERKGLSATVHFRQVDADRIPEVKSIVRRTVESLSAAGSLVLRTGNMVLEIRPAVKWNKGAAVNWLKCRLQRGADPMTLLYIGDDETDEDVFRQCSDAVTIVVGMDKVDSAAQYCVSSPKEVQELLSQILISRLTNPG